MASLEVEVPCVKIPKLKIPSVKLPLGGELKGFADFSASVPTDCTLTFSLLAQLAPLLASISCLLKVLKVLASLKEFASNPLTKGPDLIATIDGAAGCITAVTVPALSIIPSIKGILQLIISFLNCFISQLESIVNLQANIDLESAKDNPVLLASLSCAQDNAQASMDNLMASLEPIEPLIAAVNTLGEFVPGFPKIELSIDLSSGQDRVQVISDLKQKITSLEAVIDSPPV